MARLDFPPSADPFSGEAQGAYINAESVHPTTKQRSYAGNAYLDMTKSRPNLCVETGALAEKIIMKHEDGIAPKATGIQYSRNGETQIVTARKEVILCAGVFNSSRLLELSGIGDAKLLRCHNLPVVVDNPSVGENLQNHPICGLSYEVAAGLPTIDALARQEPAAVGAAMEAYSTKQAGPFAHSGTFASAQIPLAEVRTEKGQASIEKLLKSSPGPSSTFDKIHTAYVHEVVASPKDASGYLITIPSYVAFQPDGSMAPPPSAGGDYFSIAVLLTNPLSRGSAHIVSGSPTDKPAIDPAYFSHPLDLEILARHIEYVDKVITHTEPLKSRLKAGGKRNEGVPTTFADLNAVKEYIRRTCVGAHHFTGTCSMMPRELGGVVDSELKVYGVQNLRVCDASVVPFVPRTNPQATVYALAERGADLIKS